MKTIFKFTFLLLIFLSCSSSVSFAKTVTKHYTVNDFNKLKVGSAFQVEFIYSNENKVTVEIDEDDADDVFVGNSGNEVSIKMKDGNYRTRIMKAIVYGKSLSGISVSGASHFSSNYTFTAKNMGINISGASHADISIDTENLELFISGASKLTLKGNAVKQIIDISGASNYNGRDCKSNIVDIDASGASKVTINCTELLDAEASGASHITYLSEPKKVKKSTSGASEVELH